MMKRAFLMNKKAGVMLITGAFLTACQSVPISPKLPISAQSQATITVKDGDDDQDGVLNSVDSCPNTPLNIAVDVKGCEVPPACLDCDTGRTELRLFFAKNATYPLDMTYFYEFGKRVIKAQKDFADEAKFYADNEKTLDSYNQYRMRQRQAYPNVCVHIEGHSSKGKQGENSEALAKQRVDTVIQMYQERYGIDKNTFRIDYFGDERPIATNSTADGRAMNQRIFMFLTKCQKFENQPFN